MPSWPSAQGAAAQPEMIHAIEQTHPLAQEKLAGLGIPAYDIKSVTSGDEQQVFLLAADQYLVFSVWCFEITQHPTQKQKHKNKTHSPHVRRHSIWRRRRNPAGEKSPAGSQSPFCRRAVREAERKRAADLCRS